MCKESQHGARSGARRAFTIIEMMIAMFVLAVGLSALILGVSYASKTVITGRNLSISTQRARYEMEQFFASAYSATNMTVGTHTRNRTNYLATIVVANVYTNMKSITVNIPWTNMVTRRGSTTTVTTIMSQAVH